MIRCLATAVALIALGTPIAEANAQDDVTAARCPGAKAWLDAFGRTMEARMQANGKPSPPGDPALRAELDRRFEDDQARRRAAMASPTNEGLAQATMAVDKANLAWMKIHFVAEGFPSVDAVGHRGVEEAFILVQHADQDLAFQSSMLPVVAKLGSRGDVMKGDVAMLTDRVLVAQGKPQRYGTQYDIDAGTGHAVKMSLKPVEDRVHLDTRRAAMELMPQADYDCMLRVAYTPAPPAAP
ncbi:hypothetical protein FIV34_20820 [Luteibacter pinisoli]|uniref:Uncharacterized protein n=1 Tax=Luteibacter pinisoli TaxID=2589080 RepID=A0A4Y5ZBP0_9GAMM|nr:DUF6624 domain-containing protein [Luteibacter pinisoli]QDE41468.1 hypothetical protein FIV34_20820 [Luteibacter pinisoli]